MKRTHGIFLALATCVTACQSRAPAPSGSAPTESAPAAAPVAAVPGGHVEMIEAPRVVDVAAWVKENAAKLRAAGRDVVVYEGAKWCEPCHRFHEAAAAGKLDAALPKLTLLEFDADRDGEGLAIAGYASNLIPMFAVPDAEGRATGKYIEGGIKGDGAADQIVPRLQGLLASAPVR